MVQVAPCFSTPSTDLDWYRRGTILRAVGCLLQKPAAVARDGSIVNDGRSVWSEGPELQDNSLPNAKSISTGDDAVPTPPATSLAQACLLNEFHRLEVEAAAKKLRIGPQKSAAMKRYWALRKARDLRGVA